MAQLSGWLGLMLMAYLIAALFYVDARSTRALTLASGIEPFASEAQSALSRGYRSRVLWVKRHRSELPMPVRGIAQRVAIADLSCWITLAVLFALYGLQFVAL